MIEIIREEDYGTTKEKVLPKEIKQIGKPDIGDRIYVEDKVYRYLHPYDGQLEKSAYILLGRFENYTGRQCTFVESAIRLEEMSFDGELPQWNDNTWGYIYKKLKKDHDNMAIVGWAMDIRGYLPNLNGRIEKLHQNHFGGEHQVLFLMDTLEGEESFYSSRGNRLYRRDGFYIYYGKGASAAADYMAPEKSEAADGKEGSLASEAERAGRKQAGKPVRREQEKNNVKHAEKPIKRQGEKPSVKQAEKSLKRQENLDIQERIYFEETRQAEREADADAYLRRNTRRKEGSYRQHMAQKQEKERMPVVSSSLLLAVLVFVLGFAAYQNYQKMNDMQNALAKMNTIAAGAEAKETETSDAVQIEQVKGNVEKQTGTEAAAQETPESQAASGQQAGGEPSATEKAEAVTGGAAGEEKNAAGEHGTAAGTGGKTEEGEDKTAAGENAAEGNAASDQNASAEAPSTEPSSAEPSSTETKTDTPDSESGKQAEEAAALTEAQNYLKQGYYIVQKGDNMATICRKLYQTTAVMDEVCKANNIEDPNAIYAGQYLTLPN